MAINAAGPEQTGNLIRPHGQLQRITWKSKILKILMLKLPSIEFVPQWAALERPVKLSVIEKRKYEILCWLGRLLKGGLTSGWESHMHSQPLFPILPHPTPPEDHSYTPKIRMYSTLTICISMQ